MNAEKSKDNLNYDVTIFIEVENSVDETLYKCVVISFVILICICGGLSKHKLQHIRIIRENRNKRVYQNIYDQLIENNPLLKK